MVKGSAADWLDPVADPFARASVIAVERIPPEGLGEAINDRLRRAAAPRDIDDASA